MNNKIEQLIDIISDSALIVIENSQIETVNFRTRNGDGDNVVLYLGNDDDMGRCFTECFTESALESAEIEGNTIKMKSSGDYGDMMTIELFDRTPKKILLT